MNAINFTNNDYHPVIEKFIQLDKEFNEIDT